MTRRLFSIRRVSGDPPSAALPLLDLPWFLLLALSLVSMSTGAPTLAGQFAYRGPDGGSPSALAYSTDGTQLYVATGLSGIFARSSDGSFAPRNAGLVGDSQTIQARISGLTTDPEVSTRIYAFNGSFGGLFGLVRSDDAGASWTVIDSGLGIGDSVPAVRELVIDPQSPEELWATTADGVFSSDDRGATWSPKGSGLDEVANRHSSAMAFLDGQLYLGSRNGILRWNRAGQTWELIFEQEFVQIGAFAAVPGGRLLAGGDHTVLASDDGGASWSAVPWFETEPGASDFLVLPSIEPGGQPTILAALELNFGDEGANLASSLDSGATWSRVEPTFDGSTGPIRIHRLAKRPGSPNTLAAATDLGVFVSTDRGTSWSPRNLGLRANAVQDTPAVVDDRATILLPTISSVFRTEDFGTSWQDVGGALESRSAFSIAPAPSDPQRVWATNRLGDTLQSRDAGSTWISQDVGDQPGLSRGIAVHPMDPDIAVVGQFGGSSSFFDSQEGLWRSLDGGTSWTRSFEPSSDLLVFQPEEALWDPVEPDQVWFAIHYRDQESDGFTDGGVWRSRDGGGTFTEVLDEISFPDIARLADGTMLATGATGSRRPGVWRSRDGGDSWQRVGAAMLPLDVPATALTSDAESDAVAFLAYVGDRVYATADAGDSWTPLAIDGLPNPPPEIRHLAVLPSFPRRLLLGTDGGLYEGIVECVPTATVLCLESGRFRVRATWESATQSGVGQALPLTADTGTFWFFDPGNLELVVKVLDGCGVNDRQWVFSGGLTDVAVEILVTDTWTGATRAFGSDGGVPFPPIADVDAFSGCQSDLGLATSPQDRRPSTVETGLQAPADRSGQDLLLLDDRFRITASWSSGDQSGEAVGVPVTADTGYLWFFAADNVELLVKVLDGCAVNDRVWVVAGGLTDLAVELTVEDTVSGSQRIITSSAGSLFESVLDTAAFDVCATL